MAKESLNLKKARMKQIISILAEIYPEAKIELMYGSPLQLLVATALSAQCTDKRVNIVTAELFSKFKTCRDFLEVSTEELERLIYSTGMYKTKAKNIKAACEIIDKDFGGEVPDSMEDLLKLPGVGRKTANVVLGHAFGVPGLVVDTHVTRIAGRLGFVSTKNAEKIEFALMKIVPKDRWIDLTHYLIQHGRKTCKARKPACDLCEIASLCPSAGLVAGNQK